MSGKAHTGTVSCQEVCERLSDYLEGGLPPPVRARIEQHIEGCVDCAREAQQMTTLLWLFHEKLPPREPSLDIWAELGPKVQAYQEEQKLSGPRRFGLHLERFMGNVAAGAILFTQALAMNTEEKLKKYLMTNPYELAEDEG